MSRRFVPWSMREERLAGWLDHALIAALSWLLFPITTWRFWACFMILDVLVASVIVESKGSELK